MECNNKKSYKGLCCCNCKHRLQLTGHPWNKNLKGSVSTPIAIDEQQLFACANPMDMERNQAVIMEWDHGMCEMHEPKQ